MELEEKMQKHIKRVEQRNREKKIMEDMERKLQEIEKKLKEQQELRWRTREEKQK